MSHLAENISENKGITALCKETTELFEPLKHILDNYPPNCFYLGWSPGDGYHFGYRVSNLQAAIQSED